MSASQALAQCLGHPPCVKFWIASVCACRTCHCMARSSQRISATSQKWDSMFNFREPKWQNVFRVCLENWIFSIFGCLTQKVLINQWILVVCTKCCLTTMTFALQTIFPTCPNISDIFHYFSTCFNIFKHLSGNFQLFFHYFKVAPSPGAQVQSSGCPGSSSNRCI